MTNESWIPEPSRPTPLATTENLPPIRSHRTFKTYPYQIGTQRKRSCKTNFNKISIYFLFGVVFKDHPLFPNLDFGLLSVFSVGFLPLEPTILFSHSSAVFLPLEPTILFLDSSAVSHLKSRDFRLDEPTILF